MVKRKANAKYFFSGKEKKMIVQAIENVERETSGEICVHLNTRNRGDVFDRARQTFHKLGIAKTKHRNGILIYLSLADRQFAILGDQGIHNRLGDSFWNESASQLSAAFQKGEFAKGLVDVIRWFGEHLKCHFPAETRNTNELPNLTEARYKH